MRRLGGRAFGSNLDRAGGGVAGADGFADVEGARRVADGDYLAGESRAEVVIRQAVQGFDYGAAGNFLLDARGRFHSDGAVVHGGHSRLGPEAYAQGLHVGLGEGFHPERVTCSDGACRVWRDHLHVLSLGEQVHGGVDGLHVRANDDDLLGNVGHHEVVDAHHLGAGRVGQPQGVAHATGGRDYDIGGGLGDDVGGGLGIQHHVYAEYFHLALEVAAQHRQVLMGALHVIGEFQKATHGALLLVEGHGVSALGGYARRLEASRAGAHDYHVLRRGDWLGIVAAGQLPGAVERA